MMGPGWDLAGEDQGHKAMNRDNVDYILSQPWDQCLALLPNNQL